MSTTPPATAYLTPAEAAVFLRLKTARTLARWRGRGCGPRYRRVAGRALYTREDLQAWVDQHAFQNTAQEGYSR